MSDVVIEVNRVAKRYQIGAAQERYVALRDVMSRRVKRIGRMLTGHKSNQAPKSVDFWALNEVSFQVYQGECVGIIGRNGAGKSTLLKVLSRITAPTSGDIRLRGRVGSLLEVGTGFHPELTGRENISLNGAILGMSHKEVARKFDEIVAFADVEKFLDTPVKYYSSGMYMRLAFAVAAHLEPEILIVDEVLAVGDAQFQQKCLGKMGEVARGGRTVLFVSHNMAAVQSLCSRAILLDRGRIAQDGAAAESIRAYMAGTRTVDSGISFAGRMKPADKAEISNAWMERNQEPTHLFLHGDLAELVIEVNVRESCSIEFELLLRQKDGLPVAFCPSGWARDWRVMAKPGALRVRCRLPQLQLSEGTYSVDLMLAHDAQFLDAVESALSFTIESAAIGPRNWRFDQARNQGCLLWDVLFELETSATAFS